MKTHVITLPEDVRDVVIQHILKYGLIRDSRIIEKFGTLIRSSNERKSELNITRALLDILYFVCESYLANKSPTISDTYLTTGLSKGTALRCIKKLEEYKVVSKKKIYIDKRRTVLVINRKYEKILEKYIILCYGEFKDLVEFSMMSELKRTEEALRRSEERYRKLVEVIPHGIYEVDIQGRITFSNPSHARILGYELGELVGKRTWKTVAGNVEQEAARQQFKKTVRDRPETRSYISKDLRKDGKIIDVRRDWAYKKDERGRDIGFVTVLTDITEQAHAQKALLRTHDILESRVVERTEELHAEITERKRLEEELRLSERRIRDMADSVPVLIADVDANRRYRFANEEYMKWVGKGASNPVGKRVQDVVGKEPYKIIEDRIDAVLEGTRTSFNDTFELQKGERGRRPSIRRSGR